MSPPTLPQQPDALADEVAAVIGERYVLRDPDLRAPYEVDWTRRFSGSSRFVARPGSTDEVAAALRACQRAGAPVVPQGGNTGLVGGGVPRGGEVVLHLGRLDALEPVDAFSGTVVAGAGVTLAALQEHAERAGFAFGVDLAARDSATVGGLMATNAGGVHVVRHGPMRAQVRGVEAVLTDGTILRRMHGLAKDSAGYDLPGLLTGSEGTLAVITRACLRLVRPLPVHVVALLALDSVADAIATLGHLQAAVEGLSACELMLAPGLELVCAQAGLAPPFAATPPCALLVEAGGHSDPTEHLAAALEQAPVRDAAVAADRPGRAALWAYRERHTEAVASQGIAHKLDVALPLGALPTFVEALPSAVGPHATTYVWGHLAEGNVHVNVVGPAPDDERVDEAVLRLVATHGGSISAEHGVGVAKARWLGLSRDETDRAAMRAIKDALDPTGLLNPGVLFTP